MNVLIEKKENGYFPIDEFSKEVFADLKKDRIETESELDSFKVACRMAKSPLIVIDRKANTAINYKTKMGVNLCA